MTAERKLLMTAGAGVPVGSATKGGAALWHRRYAGRQRFHLLIFSALIFQYRQEFDCDAFQCQ